MAPCCQRPWATDLQGKHWHRGHHVPTVVCRRAASFQSCYCVHLLWTSSLVMFFMPALPSLIRQPPLFIADPCCQRPWAASDRRQNRWPDPWHHAANGHGRRISEGSIGIGDTTCHWSCVAVPRYPIQLATDCCCGTMWPTAMGGSSLPQPPTTDATFADAPVPHQIPCAWWAAELSPGA